MLDRIDLFPCLLPSFIHITPLITRHTSPPRSHSQQTKIKKIFLKNDGSNGGPHAIPHNDIQIEPPQPQSKVGSRMTFATVRALPTLWSAAPSATRLDSKENKGAARIEANQDAGGGEQNGRARGGAAVTESNEHRGDDRNDGAIAFVERKRNEEQGAATRRWALGRRPALAQFRAQFQVHQLGLLRRQHLLRLRREERARLQSDHGQGDERFRLVGGDGVWRLQRCQSHSPPGDCRTEQRGQRPAQDFVRSVVR